MKKIGILSVLLIIATAILFSGCLQKTESAPGTGPQVTPETKTETKKPLLPKALRGLTPRETVQSFWMALKEERYTDAKGYLDPSLIKETEETLQKIYEYKGYGDRSIEELMYNRFSRMFIVTQFERIERYTIEDYEKSLRDECTAPANREAFERYGYASCVHGISSDEEFEAYIQEELDSFIEDRYSTEKIWSEKDKKPVEYETVMINYKLILKNENGMIREQRGIIDLIKIDGVWKIDDSDMFDY